MKPASASKAPASGPNGARIKRDRRWAYLFGAICPARGTGADVITSIGTREWAKVRI